MPKDNCVVINFWIWIIETKHF